MEGRMALIISSSDSMPSALNIMQMGTDLRTKGRPTCKASDFLIIANVTLLTCLVSGDRQDIDEKFAI
jgi:hypothetical protein